jgi:hypothetical protein
MATEPWYGNGILVWQRNPRVGEAEASVDVCATDGQTRSRADNDTDKRDRRHGGDGAQYSLSSHKYSRRFWSRSASH